MKQITGKQCGLILALALIIVLWGATVSANHFDDRILELGNSTGQTIWVAKSHFKFGLGDRDVSNLRWTSVAPGNWLVFGVSQGGYLYLSYGDQDKFWGLTPDRHPDRPRYFRIQLPRHGDYRWFWRVVQSGGELKLDADYERARGRDASR